MTDRASSLEGDAQPEQASPLTSGATRSSRPPGADDEQQSDDPPARPVPER